MFQRRPSRVQVLMIALMGLAAAALAGWAIPELIGVFTECTECTYSEWVWDLPLWAVLLITVVQAVVGIAAIWSGGHYLEGWARRRKLERQAKDPQRPD
jgi:hypothetical protein